MKKLTTILFYGALWGLLEATIGHFLHFIPATIAGAIMFPIASVILVNAYLKTQSRSSLIYIGVVASLIKAVDFLLPSLSIYKTINPMVSIVFEALLVVAVIAVVSKDTVKDNIISMQVASILWRAVFIGYMAVLHVTTGLFVPYLADMSLLVEFLVIQGILSGLLATGLYYVVKVVRNREFEIKMNPVLSGTVFALALIATYYL
jgi:hypothetical protein